MVTYMGDGGMNAMKILSEAERLGIRVRVAVGVIECCPRGALPDELRRRIIENKAELIEVLIKPSEWVRRAAAILAEVADNDLRADLRYCYEERCGIAEYDGELSRPDAEKLAYHELLRAMERDGILAGGGSGERVA